MPWGRVTAPIKATFQTPSKLSNLRSQTSKLESQISNLESHPLPFLELFALFVLLPAAQPAATQAKKAPREQIDLDSFDFLNVLIALNERLGVEVPETDYPKVQTLNKMVDYFSRR